MKPASAAAPTTKRRFRLGRVASAVALIVVACFLAAHASAEDDRDLVVDKKNVKKAVYIVTEQPDKLVFKLGSNAKEQTMKWNELAKVEYVEMRAGPWPTAMDARDRGKYEEAADLFNQVETGGKEWQKVYGAFYEGDALELAGKYDAAAEAFAKVDQFAKHRLWLDAKYRQGFCLGLAKKGAEALKIADELTAWAKTNTNATAETRANAVRAAAAAGKGDAGELGKNAGATRFSPVNEADEWFHFALFEADSLRRLGKHKDAEGKYRILVGQLDNDPAKKAQASFGFGLCLVESDKQAALVELLKLDALPYGSPEQKCEARFVCGKLLWEEAKAGIADPEAAKDEKRSAFHKGNAKAARMLLAAAAGSTADSPAKASANSLLEQIGPDPDEKADKDKTAKDPKDTKAADADSE